MNLPNELVAEIFCYADVVVLIKCSQVNYCWNGLSKIRYVWEFKWVQGNNDIRDGNLRGISHVHTLDLCDRMKIENVSCLANIHSVYLWDTFVEDVSALGNVHTLDLCGTYVVNVNSLSRVHTLFLYNTSVEDISALGGMGGPHTLEITDTCVEDISALGGVHTLDLRDTILDVSPLCYVHTLILRHSTIADVSVLRHVHTLDLNYTILEREDVSALENVYQLTLPNGQLVCIGKCIPINFAKWPIVPHWRIGELR